MIEIIPDKATLRRTLLAARNAIAAELRRQWDASIGARILDWHNDHPVSSLGIFYPIRSEPDLRDVFAELGRRGVQLSLPTVAGSAAPLRFAAWAPGEALSKDAMGVPVPAEPHRIVQPQALLIPCVGFNAGRIRLGYGGGFYDRTLAAAPRPLAIGVGYACCQADFAGEAHDVALDLIVTESASLAAHAPG